MSSPFVDKGHEKSRNIQVSRPLLEWCGRHVVVLAQDKPSRQLVLNGFSRGAPKQRILRWPHRCQNRDRGCPPTNQSSMSCGTRTKLQKARMPICEAGLCVGALLTSVLVSTDGHKVTLHLRRRGLTPVIVIIGWAVFGMSIVTASHKRQQ